MFTRTALLFLAAVAAWGANAPNVTSLTCSFANGQTFCRWTDPTTGTPGNYRYDVYWSTSQITDAMSLAAATLVQDDVFNNSAQMVGQFTYNQTTRTDTSKYKSIIAQAGNCNDTTYGGSGAANTGVCGSPLSAGALSGLAVHTALSTATAYYAVITHDRTGAETDSPVLVGNNATTSGVSESVGTMVPLKYFDSADATHRTNSTVLNITGVANRPFYLKMHASGGCSGNIPSGDLWQFWGDSTMGHQEGIQQVFAVPESHSTATSGGVFTVGQRAVGLFPCDPVWTYDALGQLETYWFGYKDTPLGGSSAQAWPYTERILEWMMPWTQAHYQTDPERVYAFYQSMSAWGQISWALLRRPSWFAAIFPSMPRWRAQNTAGTLVIPSWPDKGQQNAGSIVMGPNPGTTFGDWEDAPTRIAADCSQRLPFVAWGIGRNDTFSAWADQVTMVNVFKACHYGFAFAWNNGDHSAGTNAIPQLMVDYQTVFLIHTPYPAFGNFSLDSNPGDGTIGNGDCASGTTTPVCYINEGFSWTTPAETARTWSTAISNSQISSGNPTVDVTPRNNQTFAPAVGSRVIWATSSGQSGSATVDAYGLVTATGVTLASTATTITFTAMVPTSSLGGKATMNGTAGLH